MLTGWSQEPVIKRGEELLKRKAAVVNLDDSDLIRRLFMLFNGMWFTQADCYKLFQRIH